MFENIRKCIDAGTENCPCHLAESGNCITCSKLQGKDCKGCDWKGVCIYNEYVQNGRIIKDKRKEIRVKIISKKKMENDNYLFTLSVGRGMALKCSSPGIYILARREKNSEIYNVPISIINSDIEKGEISFAIKAISVKTHSLAEEEESFIIKGPFRNGMFGIEHFFDNSIERVLVISKGIGVAPGIKIANYFNEKNKEVKAIFDMTNTDFNLAVSFLNLNVRDLSVLEFAKEKEITLVKRAIESKDYDLVAICASDYYCNLFGYMATNFSKESKIAMSNNFNICCGEGICGSCSIADDKGQTLKMCKCKLDAEDIVKRGKMYV